MAGRVATTARTVLVSRGSAMSAYNSITRIMNNTGLQKKIQQHYYYEKPTKKRERLEYEKCHRIYNREMKCMVEFVMKQHAPLPPVCFFQVVMLTGGSSKANKIQVSTSALVDLKAALFQKQQDIKRGRRVVQPNDDGTLTRKVSEKTAAIWKNARKKVKGQNPSLQTDSSGTKETPSTDNQLSHQEEEELQKSRQALEAKAALYDRLSHGQGLREIEESEEGEEESRYMVDFTKKIYQELRENGTPQPACRVTHGSEEPTHATSVTINEEDELVEYVDSFGRTRRCPKGDIPEIIISEKGVDYQREQRSSSPQLLSEDMRRERERQMWEKEVEEELGLDQPVGPTHYQSVQEGEIRSHGVGYYQFSQEEEERKKQMDMLDKLRKETTVQTEKKQKLQEKRKALLEARLAKVREKKLKQKNSADGIADFTFEAGSEKIVNTSKTDGDDLRSLLDSELERAKEKDKDERRQLKEDKRASHLRPWDKGKVMDPIKRRKQELEKERLPEFAPPTAYLDSGGTETKKIKIETSTKMESSDSFQNTQPTQDQTFSNIPGTPQPLSNVATTVTDNTHQYPNNPLSFVQPPHYLSQMVPPLQWNPSVPLPPPFMQYPYIYSHGICPTATWNQQAFAIPPGPPPPPNSQYSFPPQNH